MTPEQAYQDILDSKKLLLGSIKSNAKGSRWGGAKEDPKRYRENFKQFKRLDVNQIRSTVEQYLKDHPDSSQFE